MQFGTSETCDSDSFWLPKSTAADYVNDCWFSTPFVNQTIFFANSFLLLFQNKRKERENKSFIHKELPKGAALQQVQKVT